MSDIIYKDIPPLGPRFRDFAYARIQYEAGIRSIPEIAAEIQVSPPTLIARASNEHWIRDPLAKAKMYTETLIAREEVARDKEILERARAERVNAEMQARVLVQHRTDIQRARLLTMRLFSELEDMTENLALYESLANTLAEDGSISRQSLARFRSVLNLDDRVDINKKLTDALKAQLQLERQAFGILGALEDPEVPQTGHASGHEIEKILDKFDLVLKSKSEHRTSTTTLGEVVDVP